MSALHRQTANLPPETPTLDVMTRQRRRAAERALAKSRRKSSAQVHRDLMSARKMHLCTEETQEPQL